MPHARLALAVITGALVALAPSSAVGDYDGNYSLGYSATLLGSSEVASNGARGVGDRDGRGGATLVVDGNKFCYGIVVTRIGTPVAAHLHRGVTGRNGPIVIPFLAPRLGNLGASSGCLTISRTLADQIRRNPGGFYVNVHTAAFRGGAVRGQLRR